MGYLKMQGGELLVTGRCSEPKYRRVGQDSTPRCTVGIAAGKHPTEVDDKGNPKTIWINVTAWRGQADVLAKPGGAMASWSAEPCMSGSTTDRRTRASMPAWCSCPRRDCLVGIALRPASRQR